MPNSEQHKDNDEASLSNTVAFGTNAAPGSNTPAPQTAQMPKHFTFPEYANSNSELQNELVICLFTVGATMLQFINIYRTNWWLPHAQTHNIVNLYLIDPHLLTLILLITTRRFWFVCFLIYPVERFKQVAENRQYICWIIVHIYMILMGYCIYNVYQTHSFILLFFLTYPAIIYVLIFGFQIEPFMRTAIDLEGPYFNGMPMHSCSLNAPHIRDEVDTLRNDFNKRFKQVIFTSVVNAYYAALLPCIQANSVQYNVMRAAQHVIIVWLSGFSLTTIFLFPAKYSDILHRASLHLGCWIHLGAAGAADTNVMSLVYESNSLPWCKSTVYAPGSFVKYNGSIYCSIGLATAAVPGNQSQLRFYKLFHNPTIIYATMTALQAVIIFVQLFSLTTNIEWHFVLSISFVTLTNQFVFFKLMRDYLITKRLYSAERLISEKHFS